MKLILIAASVLDATSWLIAQPAAPSPRRVLIVTPRSPDRAAGQNADAIFATPDGRAHDRYQDLLARSMPAVMTSEVLR